MIDDLDQPNFKEGCCPVCRNRLFWCDAQWCCYLCNWEGVQPSYETENLGPTFILMGKFT